MSEFTLDTNYVLTDCIRIARDMIVYAQPGYPQATRDYLRGEYTALSVMLEVHGKDDDKSQRFLKAVAAWKADQIAAELSIKVPNKALKATAPTVALIVAGLLDNSRNQFGHLNDGIKKAATGGTVNAGMNGYLTTY